MRRLVALFMIGVLLAAGSPGPTQASEAPASVPAGLQTAVFETATRGPVVAKGVLTDKQGAKAAGWVALLAWPNEAILRRVPIGGTVQFPTVGWARTDAKGRYEVRVDPTRLPDGYLSAGGQGTQAPGISYQNKWNGTYCSRVDPGTWRREESGNNAYTMSGGVKSSSIIGINLSVNAQYSKSSGTYKKTGYEIARWTYLCGNNAKPGKAGRITDNGRNTP